MTPAQNQKQLDDSAEDEARAEEIAGEIREAILEGEDYTLVVSRNRSWDIDFVFVANLMMDADPYLTSKHTVYPSKDTTHKMGLLLAKVIEEIIEASPLLQVAQYEREQKK